MNNTAPAHWQQWRSGFFIERMKIKLDGVYGCCILDTYQPRTERNDMKTQAQIIKNAVNGIFVKSLAAQKGWSKQQAAENVFAWLTCGKKVSLHDYLVAL